MRLLKKFWEKLGDEKFTMTAITIGCTLLTIINLLVLDVCGELRLIMCTLNAVMILLTLAEE